MAQDKDFNNDDFQDMLHSMFGFSGPGFGTGFGGGRGGDSDGEPIPVDAVVDGQERPATLRLAPVAPRAVARAAGGAAPVP